MAYVDPTGLGLSSALDSVQTGLSFLGLIPVVGNVFDVVNAGISAARGDYGDASLNIAAAIPGLGQAATGAKFAKKGLGFVRAADKGGDVLRGSGYALGTGKRRLFHYTDSSGAAGIRASNRTLSPGASSGGKVWATTSTPEQMFGRMGWWHRLKMGGGVNFEFGGPIGVRYSGTRKLTRYFEIDDVTEFSRDWIKGPMGQFFKRGDAAVK